jgi:glyoxylase I family protein
MAETEKFLHASFLIRDVERSRAFYTGLLGWREDLRPDLGFPGAWYRIGDVQLHLIVPADPSYLPDPERPPAGRDGHIAVRVSDFDAIVKAIEQNGRMARYSERGGKRRAFIRDPDGNMIELWEP